MRTKSNVRLVRVPVRPQDDDADVFADYVLEEEEEPACSEYVVVSHEPDLPALREHLRASVTHM